MAPRLGDRLSALRRQRFVGRDEERVMFRKALSAPSLPFNVLYIHGPGGIGKTTLLREYRHIADEEGATALSLDARNLEPTPESFLAALSAALDASPGISPVAALSAGPERRVIFVDTYEILAPLDNWLRETFLPELPENVLVVLAGRNPLSRTWRTDPGWQTLVRSLALRNLSPEESQRYLSGRQVPAEVQHAALEFTHGHPLALSLVADVLEQHPGQSFRPTDAPDVIRTLLEQFLQEVPGPTHRAALEACALFRLTTEALLTEVLDTPEVPEVFLWLRGLSFVESGPLGLFPHDMVRDALSADLRWRNPDRYAELHGRARAYYSRRLAQTHGREQQIVLSDYMYLHRDNPIVRPFLDWQETGTTVPDTASEEDLPALVEMVARHEGEESARLAEYWLRRQPASALVFRGTRREPTGFMTLLRLEDTTAEDREADPAVGAACRHLAACAPLRQGERATHFRFWLGRDDYQSVSSTQSLAFLKIAQHYLTTSGLAFTFLPVADAEFWNPFFSYIDLFRVPGADFRVGGREYRVFGHDWRVVPPLVWLDLLAQRELDPSPPAASPLSGAPPVPHFAILDETGFAAAVHDALRCFTRPREMRRNPLLRTRLVAEEAGPDAPDAERVSALQALIRRSAEQLRASPKQARLYDALHHTYFHPAPNQERAAQLLYVSFSTFRRHLKAGVDHVADTLWQWETTGRAGSG
ncbi:MAG TPA: AAA family ATPase [Longimicrobiaceae bacterium]|nr:AAA family ATPase [Longimicrobiaceae bacterium]